ncbi:MAG: hypothetical protein KC476_03985 [Cyanobacteria bacterium HKST-UBA06]|nr:hypothetical protein [Cyanobacteria bacterium HKST-UBA06]
MTLSVQSRPLAFGQIPTFGQIQVQTGGKLKCSQAKRDNVRQAVEQQLGDAAQQFNWELWFMQHHGQSVVKRDDVFLKFSPPTPQDAEGQIEFISDELPMTNGVGNARLASQLVAPVRRGVQQFHDELSQFLAAVSA